MGPPAARSIPSAALTMTSTEDMINIVNLISLAISLVDGASRALQPILYEAVILYFPELYLFVEKFMDSSDKSL